MCIRDRADVAVVTPSHFGITSTYNEYTIGARTLPCATTDIALRKTKIKFSLRHIDKKNLLRRACLDRE